MINRVMVDDAYLRNFVVGPSFCENDRKILIPHFLANRALLKDAYVACALLFDSHKAPVPPEASWLKPGVYRRAAAAIASLRSFSVRDEQDMASCLVLGGSILSFSSKLDNSRTLAVASEVLSLVKPIYEHSVKRPWIGFGFLTCVASFETFECLFRGGVPTVRVQPIPASNTSYVDRRLGIAGSILVHIHDLCELSQIIAAQRIRSGEITDPEITIVIAELEKTIRSWRPTIPENFTNSYTSVEISNMLCQAQVMQSAALLVIHRLRYPFGAEKATGLSLASGILSQLEMTELATKQIPRGIEMALLAACLEVPEEADKISEAGSFDLSQELADSVRQLASESGRVLEGRYWDQLGDLIALRY